MQTSWTKKLAALALAVVMLFSVLTACGQKNGNNTAGNTGNQGNNAGTEEPGDDAQTPDAGSGFTVADTDEEIYMNNLGEFYDAYQLAVGTENESERNALLAVSEAKLLEAAAGTQMYAGLASYNMTRLVYNSAGYASWRGEMNDYSQYVLTNEIITTEDYNHLKEMWKELQGTGTYIEKAKEYLTEKGYTFKDTINGTFSDNPTTWNIFEATTANDTSFVRPTFDYLYVYDAEGTLIPHLAESYEVSEDNRVYTFHIREGAQWVDSQGRKVADLTADDWVASAQHLADCKSQNYTMLGTYIEGMAAYFNGETTDFSTVGVKALDDHTLQYTLVSPTPYFMSMVESLSFLPLCRSYFLSQGGAFGVAEFSEASASPNYVYGLDQNHIAYCGQFLCVNMTEKNSVNYVLNDTYWNAENAVIKSVKNLYNDGSDISRTYTDFMAGNSVSMYLSTAHMETAKANGDFDKYAVLGNPGRGTICFWFNLHRQAYANMADGAAPSAKTDTEKEIAEAAFQNVHFRRALAMSIDRSAFVAQSVGEDLKYISLRNTIVPGDYVALKEDVTIDINGTATTFPAGTWYGEIVQAQMDADEFPIQVWDAEKKTTDGWDAWYNPELAAQELAIAIEELAGLGYEVSAENPIVVDYPCIIYNEVSQNQGYVLKANVEESTNGLIRFDMPVLNNSSEFLNVMNNTNSGAEVNYDMGGSIFVSASFDDPRGYTESLLPFGDGSLTQRLGLW